MNTCKTCKHWSKHEPNPYESWFTPEELLTKGECDTYVKNPKKDGKDTGFDVILTGSDTHGMGAILVTGADFSCMHYEPK